MRLFLAYSFAKKLAFSLLLICNVIQSRSSALCNSPELMMELHQMLLMCLLANAAPLFRGK